MLDTPPPPPTEEPADSSPRRPDGPPPYTLTLTLHETGESLELEQHAAPMTAIALGFAFLGCIEDGADYLLWHLSMQAQQAALNSPPDPAARARLAALHESRARARLADFVTRCHKLGYKHTDDPGRARVELREPPPQLVLPKHLRRNGVRSPILPSAMPPPPHKRRRFK